MKSVKIFTIPKKLTALFLALLAVCSLFFIIMGVFTANAEEQAELTTKTEKIKKKI